MKEVSNCSILRPLREKVAEGRMRGFTLIELLVAVIIIAILAAIAVPQYKHATLKARFSTVMPMAKAIADAQEVYYQGRQLYALDVDELDVTPVNAENTSVSLSQTDGYDYVMAQNSRVPGAHYVIYQKYSENYPSEIHCEAEDGNEDAQWLCGVLSNNNSIGKTVTDGYTTYIMKGTGAGLPVGAGDDNGGVSCSAAEAMGLACNITTNEAGEQVKQICTNGVCRTKTYNEDGSYTSVTCIADSNGVCTSNWKSATYDANGNMLKNRMCAEFDGSGNCTGYEQTSDYIYDSNGNKLAERSCSRWNWGTMDSSSGNCLSYTSGSTYTYDANGNMLTSRDCISVSASGICTEYSTDTWESGDYTYDANGNRLVEKRCDGLDGNGNCTGYSGIYNFTYDSNGNRLTQRICSSADSSGNCTGYASDGNYNYTYDGSGRLVTEKFCPSVDNSGNCTEYGEHRDYTYDDHGNVLTTQYCYGDNINATTGECISYDGTSVGY